MSNEQDNILFRLLHTLLKILSDNLLRVFLLRYLFSFPVQRQLSQDGLLDKVDEFFRIGKYLLVECVVHPWHKEPVG